MGKLRTEIESTFGGRSEMSRSDLRSMKYLQNILKESRLTKKTSGCRVLMFEKSSEALSFRPSEHPTAVRHTFLPVGGGPDLQSPVFIPEGAAVAYSVYSMHRRPDFYGMDAELYRPERWDEHMPLKDDPINASWGYLPLTEALAFA